MFAVSRYAIRKSLNLILSGCECYNITNSCTAFKQLQPNEFPQQIGTPILVNSLRGYSKAKSRQGSTRHSSVRPKVELRDDELEGVLRVGPFRESLARLLQHLGDSYLKQLTTTNPSSNVGNIMVNFDGDQVQLCEVAQIQKKANLVVLRFTSFPEAIKPAIKAIQDSGTHVSIQQDATSVFLHFPKVTREQRENMAKNAKTLFQKCKDELAQVERKIAKEIQKNKEGQSEDLIYNAQQQVKYEISQTVTKAEHMMKAKQKELLDES